MKERQMSQQFFDSISALYLACLGLDEWPQKMMLQCGHRPLIIQNAMADILNLFLRKMTLISV